ncbi:hypothetical protein [Spiroplasma endosymbiont of Cleonymus obscurus]
MNKKNKEKIKVKNHEFELYDYQIDTLLDIIREMIKANIYERRID